MKIGVWDTGRGDAGVVRANVGEVLVERAETGLRDMGGVMYSNDPYHFILCLWISNRRTFN